MLITQEQWEDYMFSLAKNVKKTMTTDDKIMAVVRYYEREIEDILSEANDKFK